ncbi:hypothetical protein DB346_02065 [Verrucomicrobia bacterium LW23]|nr:hypothetical protein DB346_02065 [Verrucomicrobia bacterium LW23]
MRILITTGPSYAPIDQVRRITNVATGHIGTLLATRFLQGGCDVFLARGEGCTSPAPAWQEASGPTGARLVSETFGTNEDLDEILKDWAGRHAFHAVFHAAALGDFRVKEIHYPQEVESFKDKALHSAEVYDDVDSALHNIDESVFARDEEKTEFSEISSAPPIKFNDKAQPDSSPVPKMPAKIGSEIKTLHVVLTAARKLLPRFRQRFGPDTRIVGWKYELDGSREVAVAQAHQQIEKCQSNASVINGRAYGPGYGICLPGGDLHHCADREALVEWLFAWITSRPSLSIK